MSDGPHVPMWSIVLPVHNQQDHLVSVVTDYVHCLSTAGPFELLLVPNGCTDASAQLCADLAVDDPRVKVVDGAQPGWGAAVRAGLSAASGQVLCYTNLARTSAPDLRMVLDEAAAHPEAVVKAVRPVRGQLRRRLGSGLYNAQARVLIGVDTRDVNATPKAFPRRFSALLDLTRDDDLIDLEFMVVCAQQDLLVIELPVHSTARHGGISTTTWRSALHLYAGVVRMRLSGVKA